MLVKNLSQMILGILFFVASSLSFPTQAKADVIVAGQGQAASGSASAGMWGSGYWGGTQGCNYNWQQGSGAVDIADEVKEEYSNIQALKTELAKQKLEKKRADQEMDFARRKLERSFSSGVIEFLLDVHIEKLNQCSNYKTVTNAAGGNTGSTTCEVVDANGKVVSTADQTLCGAKDDIPAELEGKWLGASGYCTATSSAKAGDVAAKICNDDSLRPKDAPKSRSYSSAECGRSLAGYKKNKLKSDKAQDRIDQIEDEIRERQYAISDARERAKIERQYSQSETSESYCPECVAASRGYSYSKPKTDWASVATQVGLGLGLGFLGAKYDKAAMEYQAQLGYPPQQGYPTAVSMGLPFILGGVYGALNGTSGQGGFGCASGMNGTGYPYGVQGGMNGVFGGPQGVYGPYAAGGVFGYPQGMYGSPWGGGMYMPGYGAGGMIAGPWGGMQGGGLNGGYAFNAMMNGGFMMPTTAMCYVPPCPGGGMVGGMGNMMSGGYPMMGGYPMTAAMMSGGYMMNGGYPMMGNMMNGGYPSTGMMISGGFMMNGGYPMGGMASMMSGYPMSGMMSGYPMSGMMSGGYPMMGTMMSGGYPMMGGMGTMGMGSMMMDTSYQLQMQQQMMQMQMAQQQQAMQYYQMQMQAQMEAYQRQAAIQQQAGQVQQEIMSLQMRLQMIYSGAYSTSGSGLGTSIPQVGIPNTGFQMTNFPGGYQTTIPGAGFQINTFPGGTQVPTGTQVTVPNGR